MANVAISTVLGGTSQARSGRIIVFTSAAIGYCFFRGGPVQYKKTTDGGATWGTAVNIGTNTTGIAFDVWYDQWTPGDTGTLIHCWYFDTTQDTLFYRSLDTNGDSLGTERTIIFTSAAAAARGSFVSGTKARSGYLYCAFQLNTVPTPGFGFSTDAGATWTTLHPTNIVVEATTDEALLFPASNTGDDNDVWIIYQDASADALTMKMYDSSAATIVESSTMQTMVDDSTDGTGQRGFTGSVRHSDGHLIVVSCSERDTATADMQAWDVSAVNSASLTGITAKTDITTNIDDNYYPAVCIDQDTDTIYVAYNGKRDGSETLGTTTKIYYTKSTDGGTSWTAGDTALDEAAATTNLQVWAPLSGHRFTAVWRSANNLRSNKVNSVVLYTLVAGQGSFTFTGESVTLTYTPSASTYTLTAAQGSFTLSGQSVTLKVSVPAEFGSFTLSGQSVTLAVTMPATQGSFVETGQSVNLLFGRKLTAAQGSFTLSEQSVTLAVSLPAAQGSFVETGQSVNLLFGHKLTAAQGSFTETGQDASLIYTHVGAFAIAANHASFTLSGQATILAVTIPAAQGSFTLSGQSVTLAVSLPAAFGSFIETGQAATFSLARRLIASHGSFSKLGQDVTLEIGRFAEINAGLFAETGQSISFLYGKAITGTHGSFIVSGQDVELRYHALAVLHPLHGEFALNGQNVFFSFNYNLLRLDFDRPTRARSALTAGTLA